MQQSLLLMEKWVFLTVLTVSLVAADVVFLDTSGNGCGNGDRLLTTAQGTIMSKSWPTRTNEKLKCIWEVNVPSGRSITFTFDTTTYEVTSSQSNCWNDAFVAIFTGDVPSNGNLVGMYCGKQAPTTAITVLDSKAIIVYIKPSNNNAAGFKLTYTSAVQSPSVQKLTPTSGCGSNPYISTGKNNISTPTGLTRNLPSMFCGWRLNWNANQSASISLRKFTMPSATLCLSDSFTVYAADQSRGYCGTLPRLPYTVALTNGSSAIIFFYSSTSSSRRTAMGFDALVEIGPRSVTDDSVIVDLSSSRPTTPTTVNEGDDVVIRCTFPQLIGKSNFFFKRTRVSSQKASASGGKAVKSTFDWVIVTSAGFQDPFTQALDWFSLDVADYAITLRINGIQTTDNGLYACGVNGKQTWTTNVLVLALNPDIDDGGVILDGKIVASDLKKTNISVALRGLSPQPDSASLKAKIGDTDVTSRFTFQVVERSVADATQAANEDLTVFDVLVVGTSINVESFIANSSNKALVISGVLLASQNGSAVRRKRTVTTTATTFTQTILVDSASILTDTTTLATTTAATSTTTTTTTTSTTTPTTTTTTSHQKFKSNFQRTSSKRCQTPEIPRWTRATRNSTLKISNL